MRLAETAVLHKVATAEVALAREIGLHPVELASLRRGTALGEASPVNFAQRAVRRGGEGVVRIHGEAE